MEIEKVELLGTTKKEQANGMRPIFYVKTVDGDKMYVPVDEPTNRHYRDIKLWYESLQDKPFKFEFAEI